VYLLFVRLKSKNNTSIAQNNLHLQTSLENLTFSKSILVPKGLRFLGRKLGSYFRETILSPLESFWAFLFKKTISREDYQIISPASFWFNILY
jgi:hypothetical protein